MGEAPYDMILLNGIVQHFDATMLEKHLQNACAMMGDDGLLIWGSVPQRRYRRQYDAGRWSTDGKPSPSRLIRSWGSRVIGLDAMGYWYEPPEIAALAGKYGLHAQFVPSKLYPYRFHAVLRKESAYAGRQRDGQNLPWISNARAS